MVVVAGKANDEVAKKSVTKMVRKATMVVYEFEVYRRWIYGYLSPKVNLYQVKIVVDDVWFRDRYVLSRIEW